MKTTKIRLTAYLISALLFSAPAAFAAGDRPAKIVTSQEELQADYSSADRKFTGIPSLAVAPDGRLWATWYAGVTPAEDDNNYVTLATSNDGGDTWTEVLVVDPDGAGPFRAFDPEVWMAPDNTLWLFWAQTIKHDGPASGVWCVRTSGHDRENGAWSAPERIADGVMMCKPTVLSTGEWLLPVATWGTEGSAKAVASDDGGKTWRVKGACTLPEAARECDENMIVERRDGSLWMLIRTRYGIGESFSQDGGVTWSEGRPSNIEHTTSRFFIRRLASGSLLLVKHGPIHIKTRRTHLMAFLSDDDGATWTKGLLLDERREAAYPDGQQAADGRIYITYDYDRIRSQNIFMTSFTEEDIRSADYDERMIEVLNNRKTVSAGGANESPRQQ